MALTPSTRLGPYEISAQIGAGALGEVYRATDTNSSETASVLKELGVWPECLRKLDRRYGVLKKLK